MNQSWVVPSGELRQSVTLGTRAGRGSQELKGERDSFLSSLGNFYKPIIFYYVYN